MNSASMASMMRGSVTGTGSAMMRSSRWPPDDDGPTTGPRWTVCSARRGLYGTRVSAGMTFGARKGVAVEGVMRRLAILVLVALLAAPGTAAAFPPPGEPVGIGDSWVVSQGGEPPWGMDRMRVTVLGVRTPRAHGLMRPPAGKRVYLLHLRYDWVEGRPAVGYWDWRAQRRNGRWLRMRPVRGLKRLPITLLLEDARPSVHGWLAWYGPGDPSLVAFVMAPEYDQRWTLRP